MTLRRGLISIECLYVKANKLVRPDDRTYTKHLGSTPISALPQLGGDFFMTDGGLSVGILY
jgi:hypothetical protein